MADAPSEAAADAQADAGADEWIGRRAKSERDRSWSASLGKHPHDRDPRHRIVALARCPHSAEAG